MYKDKADIKKTDIFEPKVLVFACNWCSYAGADNAGVSRIAYSPNVRLLRVMCSGRVHPSFVLQAFAEGSDGVIVSGCHFGDCHYMFGNYRAEEQYEKLKELVSLIGLESERITLEWISAAEGPRFAEVINNFVEQIRNLGPSPLVNGYDESLSKKNQFDLKDYRAYECLECGRCTAICPVARTHHNFSPRRLLSRGISQGIKAISSDPSVWACLTCKLCETVCPSDIPYSELNIKVRSLSNTMGIEKTCTHGGVFEQISTLMTRDDIQQNRLDWLTDDLHVKHKEGETIYFTGCSPYFAAYFGEPYKDKLIGSMRAAVKLMNKMNIEPLVLPNELCCGHDFLLRGEENQFNNLAQRVSGQIKKTKANRIVFTCPECLVTLRDEYPKWVGGLGVELLHLSELLIDELSGFEFEETPFATTYQDPCRLGRYSGIYDQPREILQAVPGVEVKEMHHKKEKAICCGNTAWIGCDAGTKETQKSRLDEALKTDCKNLITSCPKCLIHLTCSQNGEDESSNNKLNINDIWNFVGEHLQKEGDNNGK